MSANILDKFYIVIPSLNPDEKLMQVVEGMIAAGFSRIVIVNDGSRPENTEPFAEAGKRAECTVLMHEGNRGKGAGLKTAFAHISNISATEGIDVAGVITVDGDNQHRPEDAVKLAEAIDAEPDKVALGVRDFSKSYVPWKSRMGNRITTLVFLTLCGINLSDTQTGLRGIPGKYLKDFMDVEGERFEYETNMLLYMRSAGIEFVEIPIATIYIEGNKSSHFHPLRDSAKIYGPILKFASGSLFSFIIDIGLFTLILQLLPSPMAVKRQILIASVVARVFSSLFNYIFNRKTVFKSDAPKGESVVRYYMLAAVIMVLSYVFVSGIVISSGAEGFTRSFIKVIVDMLLFFASYYVQREWVFADKR